MATTPGNTDGYSLSRRFEQGTRNNSNSNSNSINSINSTNRSTPDIRDYRVRSSAINFCLVLTRSLEVIRGLGEYGPKSTISEGITKAENDTVATSTATTTTNPNPCATKGVNGVAKLAPYVLARCQTKPSSLQHLVGNERDLLFMILRESLADIVRSRQSVRTGNERTRARMHA
eukprot:jgi/Psemu1/310812/fgenesh1_kg.683_\